jgi:D-alanyl-D-alanine carboxypeptidase-like protein
VITRARALLLGALLTLGGCGLPGAPATQQSLPPADPVPRAYAVSAPGPLRGRTVTPDLLVYAQDTLAAGTRARVERAAGVGRTATLAVGQVALAGRVLRIAAADPVALRPFTPASVAATDDVWTRVAEGELALAEGLRGTVETADGYLVLGQQDAAPRVHVAAYASLPPLVDVVLNPRWGSALGMRRDNAMLVSVRRDADVAGVAADLRRRLGKGIAVQQLSTAAQASGPQTAYLTGGSVARAVGTFSYRPNPDGTVTVDPRWASAAIVTEDVPILGRVTCHRAILPQLRAALAEVVRSGLADRIDPAGYGGCFHPRYVANDPAQGLSLHSWGIAVDLNVPDNQRGTAGEMDREVVAIFKSWGFAWGGDWGYTDPMHFELNRIVNPG